MRYPAEVLTKDEIERLLDACGTTTWTARRNRALIVVMYRAGLRLVEALALRPCDVDQDRRAIRVLNSKGGKFGRSGLTAGGWGSWSAGWASTGRCAGRPASRSSALRQARRSRRQSADHRAVPRPPEAGVSDPEHANAVTNRQVAAASAR